MYQCLNESKSMFANCPQDIFASDYLTNYSLFFKLFL
jgi:hypothetical protein